MAVVMEGPLSKWTNVVKGWQYRWFVLDDNAGLLSYYTSKEKMMRGARRGCLRLKGANIGIDDEEESTFTITCDQKIFHFQARDSDEREKWLRALEDTIKRHSQPRKRILAAFGDHEFDPSEESLGQRLAEAEAYYKILTQQVKALELKMISDPVGTSSERYNTLRESTTKMLEAIGKSLEMMYAVKGECEKPVPKNDEEKIMLPLVNNHFTHQHSTLGENQRHFTLPETSRQRTPDPPSSPTIRQSKSDTELSLKDKTPSPSGAEDSNLEQIASKATSKSNIEISLITTTSSTEAITNVTSSFKTDPITVPSRPAQGEQVGYSISPVPTDDAVPYTSYSSSDEEAEFFDADEYQEPEVLPPRINPQPTGEGLSEDEYDVEDNDYGGKEGESVEQHSSVITHLLSQVRLGMDLTKVVLPTFILERRSLLEMYADFFAHPDLFCSIVDYKDPKDRMITVTKWFLSAFHAGRKSSVAKKPYNPILGETFKCHWILPEFQENRDGLAEDGPVPWASRDDVSFVAEQVSHHPPISAFYAEHVNKKIAFCAHIWTKSKFLGLSVGVECVGQGCVSVLPYDEEYIVTFPNGYGRSILTVPWMEIGGKTSIVCAKTGYNANIQFHCKPFYGGKKHRITGEVYGPDDSKKPFMTVAGEWNGQMQVKYSDREPELFIDTTTMPVITKKVKKIEKQEEFESRRLWQHVTNNLKTNNIEMATEYKHKLEQRQRDEAKDRKARGVSWETKLFHEVGEHWIYDSPLQKRLSRVNPLA